MEKVAVVTAASMSKLEELAYSQGYKELDFMEAAGSSIAEKTEAFIQTRCLDRTVLLLVGKGNNGGDAYVAGSLLLEKGFQVSAIHLYPVDQCGPLCCQQMERFKKAGGSAKLFKESEEVDFGREGVILDGLVGTGFTGAAEGILAEIIQRANGANLPIISIDIPSGVCGNTGAVQGSAIQATATIYLEFPKLGFFLNDGWNYVGDLIKGSFGLPHSFLDEIKIEAFFIGEEELLSSGNLLPQVSRTRHKYDAGYVITVAGSEKMLGAGVMASYAALRAGAGLVRWFYPPELAEHVFLAPWELMKEPLLEEKRFLEELTKARALVIGPGMGRGKWSDKAISKILSKCQIPCVMDADALFFLAKESGTDLPESTLLTPHVGELNRLLETFFLTQKEFLSGCQMLAEKKQASILVKGAPNFLFVPDRIPYILPFGNPGMATAGSGDVLSGILGALLAQKMSVDHAAILGCYLHGIAGREAAEEKTMFCMTARDIIEYLPQAFMSYIDACKAF